MTPSQLSSMPLHSSGAPGYLPAFMSSQSGPPHMTTLPPAMTDAAPKPSPSSSRSVEMHMSPSSSQLSAVHGSPSRQSRSVPPTQPAVGLQRRPTVQKSPAHMASFGVDTQPVGLLDAAGSQRSTVQSTASAQAESSGVATQRSASSSHRSALQLAPSSHTTGSPATQPVPGASPSQRSTPLQKTPSSHSGSLVQRIGTQPSTGLQRSPSAHAPSSAVWAQRPSSHASTVQATSSSQLGGQTGPPSPGTAPSGPASPRPASSSPPPSMRPASRPAAPASSSPPRRPSSGLIKALQPASASAQIKQAIFSNDISPPPSSALPHPHTRQTAQKRPDRTTPPPSRPALGAA